MTELSSNGVGLTVRAAIGRRFIPLLLVALVMLAAFAARARAATPYPVATLAESTLGAEGVSVGTDSEGDQVAIWVTTLGNGDNVVEAAVRPFGGQWSAPVAISASGAPVETPDVAVNEEGEAIATWMRQTASPRWEVEVSRLSDIGATPAGSGAWSTPIIISAPGANAQEPQVGIDAEGVATAAWRQQEGGNFGTAVASEEAGTWSAPEFLSDPTNTNEAPQLVVDPAGDAAVAWNRSTAVEASVRPAGGSWTTREEVAVAPGQGLGHPSIAIDESGEVTMAWELAENATPPYIIQAASRPLGGSWSTPQNVSGTSTNKRSPQVVVTPEGHAFLAWISNYEIVESAEKDAGGAWTAAAAGPTLPGVEGLYTVKGGLDEEGNATVVIEGELTGFEGAIWLTRHSASGAWTEPAQINDVAEDQAYRPSIAVDPYGDAVIAWSGYSEAARFVKAISVDNSATLTVEKTGDGAGFVSDDLGEIECGPFCVGRYSLGTQLTLTAKPDSGSVFTGWSGACTGTDTCTVTLDAPKSVTADFSLSKTVPDTKPKEASPVASVAPPLSPLRLVKVKRYKARGVGASRYWVPAAGTLTVYGHGVKKTTVTVSKAGFKLVKLTPKGAYKARLLRNHRGFTVVKAKFRPATGGKVTKQTRRVRLVWRHG